MENDFTFQQVDGAFRWESDFMALEFRDPHVQGYIDRMELTSEQEILYYYYTVQVFQKVCLDDEEDNELVEWQLRSKRNTYDFPTITQLKGLLEHQLNDNPVIDGQKVTYASGKVRYAKTFATEGFACDDFYEITKNVNESGADEHYTFYCGTTFDPQGDLNSVGLRTPYVSRGDMEELLACVTSFIQYSLDEHNKYLRLEASSYEMMGNKIYQYEIVGGAVNRAVIEAIFAPGDRISIQTLIDNQAQDYATVVIEGIEGNQIHLEGGQTVDGSALVSIYNEPTEELLTYQVPGIAHEFWAILSDDEKMEFQQTSLDTLMGKYKRAIINRTWMCRQEHAFPIDYQTTNPVEAVTPIVRDVLRLLQGMASEDRPMS